MWEGAPWHHADLSKQSTLQAGFAPTVAEWVAWNADYIDSYLYNPIWWVQGGLSRYKISLATYDELAKLHFDDHTSVSQLSKTWNRYASGALAGLLWAKENNDINAARNIVGVSLHAMQDFYAHSTWVDAPNRRQRTWFDVPVNERNGLMLSTGTYELPDQLGIKPHGKYAPACALLSRPGMKPIFDLLTAPWSPLSNSSFAQQYRDCQKGKGVTVQVLGIKIPPGVAVMAPPGIALDNTWLAKIAVQVRGITDMTSDQAFNTAKGLALKQSVQWLRSLEKAMNDVGAGAFWQQVKSAPISGKKEDQYEVYSKFPYQFLSAGQYPPSNNQAQGEYYLRVRIKTATDTGSGTNSDIFLKAGGKEFMLDYMPRANPLIAYNDFENGDDQVYTVGPFTTPPSTVSLENRSASAGNVLSAFGKAFVEAFTELGKSIRTFMLSIIGGNADFIAQNKKIFEAAELNTITASGKGFTVDCNGGKEGHYKVHGTIKKTASSPGNTINDWNEFEVRLTQLECVNESEWDRGSNSDEPFVMALLVPLPGGIQKYCTAPFGDVDDGEKPGMNITFAKVRVSKTNGVISVPVCVMESDDESNNDRLECLSKFAGEAEKKTDAARKEFTAALGASLAEDWKVASLNIYCFKRGTDIHQGAIFSQNINKWINGKETASFSMNLSAMKSYPASASSLQLAVAAPESQLLSYLNAR